MASPCGQRVPALLSLYCRWAWESPGKRRCVCGTRWSFSSYPSLTPWPEAAAAKKKKHKKTTVLSTHPESKHSISRVHLTQLGGPALRELTVRASQPIQARAEAQFKPEEEGKGRRTLHSRNLDAVAAQIHLPYETYKSFLMSSKVARSSVLLSSLSAPPSLPGECPPSSSKLRAA